MYPRTLTQNLSEALSDTPVVLLLGARQTGKTTLARTLIEAQENAVYATLDDYATLATAKADPVGFLLSLTSHGRMLLLDEVQRAPELFASLKANVDADRRPGRFLLTGSANVLLSPRLSDSLAGRMEILTLRPLSQRELEGSSINPVDRLFASESPLTLWNSPLTVSRTDLITRVVRGGYPEVIERTQHRREAWFSSYVQTLLDRDVRDLSQIEGLTQMPRLLTALAARTGSLLNTSDLSRTLDLPYATLTRYLTLLERLFLTFSLPAWTANLTSRLTKAPKLMLGDTGLASYLLGIEEARLESEGTMFGGLLENLIALELLTSAETAQGRPSLFHFHTAKREEVDLLLEKRSGEVVGVEVKATASPSSEDFKGLRALRDATGKRFHRGVLLYGGKTPLPFGDRLFALPLSSLWSGSD